jgi:hypothetical protein
LSNLAGIEELATHSRRVIVARRTVEIAWVKITDAGRRALTGKST